MSFVAEKGRASSELERIGEQINQQEGYFDRVSDEEEEVLSFVKSVVYFGFENGEKSAILCIVETPP